MPRGAAEINAEAARLRDEAILLVTNAQARLRVAQQAITDADRMAQDAKASADAAETATGANDIPTAEGHCTAANANLGRARSAATQAFAGVAGGDPKDEWKECRTSIDRFDKQLVDLRKTGFGFVTAIVGAAALLLSPNTVPELKFYVFCTVGTLIIALFVVDCTHQVWLNAAVKRAQILESGLNYQITQDISNKFRGVEAWFIGVLLYLVFLGATVFIFWESLQNTNFQSWTQWAGLGGGILILVFAVLARLR